MRFRPNPAFEHQYRKTPEFREFIAGQTRILASSIIFAAYPYRDTGNYIDRVQAHAIGYVELEKHFAHIMEFGSVNNPPQANARRGAIAAGMRFVDDGDKPNP